MMSPVRLPRPPVHRFKNGRAPISALIAVLLLGGPLSAVATDAALPPHVHGHGEMDLVLDGVELAIELRLPAMDIVGFEHAPRGDAQHDAVRSSAALLKKGEMLFGLDKGAHCHLEKAEVESPLIAGSDAHDEKAADAHHDHGEHHDDGKHDDHGKDHHEHGEHEKHGHDAHHGEHDHEDAHEGKEHEHADVHSEFHARYDFHCDHGEGLEQVRVRLFEHFSSVEAIRVQFVTGAGQGGARLTRDQSEINLR
ncbi:MAG: DUF2796 domain-containing protein [Gammaproteobacteria bacterium]